MGGRRRNERDVPAPLLHALSHSVRRRILRILGERGEEGMLSPVEAAATLELSLTTVAYHFRVLVASNALEEVDQRQVRGTIQHFYRVSEAMRAADWVQGVLAETAQGDQLPAQ